LSAPAATAPIAPAVSPYKWPLAGHLPQFLHDRLGFLAKCAGTGAAAVPLHIGRPVWLLNHPDDIGYVIATNARNYAKSSILTKGEPNAFWGESLISANEPDVHLELRRMLQPIFHSSAIASFAEPVAALTQNMLSEWRDGDRRNAQDDMVGLMMAVNAKLLLGLDLKDAPELAEALRFRREYIERTVLALPFCGQLVQTIYGVEYERAAATVEAYVRSAMASYKDGGGSTFASLLSSIHKEHPDAFPERAAHDEILSQTVAGFETVGELLTWTLYYLGRYPEVAERVRCESWDRVLTYSDLESLPYTRMVVSEVMRLYPPSWIFLRYARSEDVLPSGTEIPKGGKVYVCPYSMHRNPRYFPDPERFDPSRFAAEAVRQRQKFSYVPFGGGPRVCIAQGLALMQSSLVTACVVREFELESELPVPEPLPGITLRAKRGAWITIKRRK
jgi:cytochrome P450